MLTDPNVWITDTAAMVHTTQHNYGMSDGKTATSDDSITIGNGKNEPASKIVSITTGWHDLQQTREQVEPNETDGEVTHFLSGKFDLFSLIRMQKQGCLLLNGNKEAIWLTKETQKVTFDMVIPTNKGQLFALYFR